MFWMAPTFSIAFFPFAIRHSPLALPNPKVHAEHNRNNLSSYTTLPHPTLSTVRCAIPRTARSIQRERERGGEGEGEGEKPPNAHRCEIALGQQQQRRLGVSVFRVFLIPFLGRGFGSVFRLCVFGVFSFFSWLLACGRVNGAGSWDWKLKIYKCKIFKI